MFISLLYEMTLTYITKNNKKHLLFILFLLAGLVILPLTIELTIKPLISPEHNLVHSILITATAMIMLDAIIFMCIEG